ncbi:hypothetical protein BDN72DRAFT_958471 [Pluteus cervinus]|uniref:Uncharacterized protein n=1 Tax=Pluteus cervinus TaxID=181527 RepID=A0ACD3AYN5_9AGAR|nr:hypothetical protein BDN72DRAFT_958471 [Pluteus cervinus]
MSSLIVPTSSATPLFFPTEIDDQILDLCEGDEDTLRSCSLVCKMWNPRARSHLFKTIRLNQRNYKAFLELLRRPTSTPVSRYVKHLYLSEGEPPQTLSWGDKTLSMLSTYLAGHLASLKLSHITFSDSSVHFEGSDAMTFSEVQKSSKGFKSITVLSLKYPNNRDITLIPELLCSFPLLEEMDLAAGHVYGDAEEWSRQQCHLAPSVTRLTLRIQDSNLFQWFLRQPCLPNVRRLEVLYYGYNALDVVPVLLWKIGATLQHLILDLPKNLLFDRNPNPPAASIAHNSNLQQLEIFLSQFTNETYKDKCTDLLQFFSAIPLRVRDHIEEIKLYMITAYAGEFDPDVEIHLGAVISSCRSFPNLKFIILKLHHDPRLDIRPTKTSLLRGMEHYVESGFIVVEEGNYAQDWEKDMCT